jgi:hypothetical protein
VSKFVGKFRKNQNYSDDYDAFKSKGQKTGRRNEHGEIKKTITRTLVEDMQEGYDYDSIEDKQYGTYN